jgi:hypothetical protein
VASLRDPESKTFYAANEPSRRSNNAALICPARRRCDVILAMLHNREHYLTPATRPARPGDRP